MKFAVLFFSLLVGHMVQASLLPSMFPKRLRRGLEMPQLHQDPAHVGLSCVMLDAMHVGLPHETQAPYKTYDGDKEMTPDVCYYFCIKHHTMYFALKGGSECVCFDTYTSPKIPVAPAVCDKPCLGAESESCGGMQAYNIHITYAWVPKLKHITCTAPPAVVNAVSVCYGGGVGVDDISGIELNATCAIKCAPGYRLETNSLLCDTARGEWLGTAACTEITCHPPFGIQNMKKSCRGASAALNDGACDIECLGGYDLVENSLKCGLPSPEETVGVFAGHAICKAKSCGVPPPHQFADVVSTEVAYPDHITYTCDHGFTLNGKHTGGKTYLTTCLQDGQLAPVTDACTPVKCGAMPQIENSVVVPSAVAQSGEIVFPQTVSYKCLEGFSLDGENSGEADFTISCDADGHFEPTFRCQPVACGLAPVVPDAIHGLEGHDATKIYTMHEVVSYHCVPGFAVEEDKSELVAFDLTCSAGVFQNEKACVPVRCGIPPVVEGATSPDARITFGMEIAYSCDAGQTVTGKAEGARGFSLSCREDATYGTPAGCKPIQCSNVPTLTRGNFTASSHSRVSKGVVYGEGLSYECEPGYSIDGSAAEGSNQAMINCLETGAFTEAPACQDINDCIGRSCGPFGNCIDGFQSYSCQCESGYSEHTEDGVKSCGNIDDCGPQACGAHGTCKDLVGDYTCECQEGYMLKIEEGEKFCSPKECGSTPAVANAEVPDITKAVFTDHVFYTCLPGFSVAGELGGETEFGIECLSSGFFSTTPKSCEPISCTTNLIEHATFVPTSPVKFDGDVTYTCKHGYTIDGSPDGDARFTSKCLASGRFSARPECMPIHCGPLPSVFMGTTLSTGGLHFGMEASYQCMPGHATSPSTPDARSFTIKCNSDAQFEGLESCMQILCSLPLVPPANVQLAFINHEQATKVPQSVNFTTELEYVCNDGHTLDGVSGSAHRLAARCGADAAIEGLSGFAGCQPIKCGAPAEAANAKTSRTVNPGDLVFGDSLGYECDAGFAVKVLGKISLAKRQLLHSKTAVAPVLTFQVSCLESGEFSALEECENIDDCQGHTCGPHGHCVDGIEVYECDCNEGFEVTPRADGELYCGNIDDCGADACGPHGACLDLVQGYTCECSNGYEVTDDPPSDHLCTPLKCHEVPILQHTLMGSPITLQYPESILIDCAEGHSVDGSASVVSLSYSFSCQEDGTLTPTTACRPVECGYAPVAQDVSSGPAQLRVFGFGDVAEYACEPGHTLDATAAGAQSFSLNCRANGLFPDVPACLAVSCGLPPFVKNALRNAESLSFPSEATYTCDVGHSLQTGERQFTRKCLATGDYEDTPQGLIAGACSKVSCGEPPVALQAQHTAGARFFQDVVEYKCSANHTIDGTERGETQWSVYCTDEGSFSAMAADACKEVRYDVRGQVRDATNNDRLRGAQVVLREGALEVSAETNNAGVFQAKMPAGNVDLKVDIAGFIGNSKNIDVEGNIPSGDKADVILSPVLPADGWRAVLTWDKDPRDLDSHLYFGNGGACHMYFSRRKVSCPNGVTATLDVDDVSSFGPETTTLEHVKENCNDGGGGCRFVFKIDNWSGRAALTPASKAVVKVFNANHVAATYSVANGDGALKDRWWSVFSLDTSTMLTTACQNIKCT